MVKLIRLSNKTKDEIVNNIKINTQGERKISHRSGETQEEYVCLLRLGVACNADNLEHATREILRSATILINSMLEEHPND
jgi:hypothetical protein